MTDLRIFIFGTSFCLLLAAIGHFLAQYRGTKRDLDAAIGELTERKSFAVKLEAELKLFASLANASPEFIGICDEHLMPIYANAAALRLIGLSGFDEIEHLHLKEFFFPEDQELVFKEFLPMVLRDGVGELEMRFRHFKTGEPIWMLHNVFNLRAQDGSFIGWATVSRDISARKAAEISLSLSEAKFRAIFEQAAVGIAHISLDGAFRSSNRRILEILGYSREELQQLRLQDVTHPEDLQTDQLSMLALLAVEISTYKMEKRFLTKGGKVVQASISLSLVRDASGAPSNFILVVEDITDRKRLSQELSDLRVREQVALDSSRLKSEFLAHMSHEIRTPINGIIGFSGLLSETVLSDDQKSLLNGISKSSTHLASLIDDILDLSKVEAGKLALETSAFDLGDFLEEIAESVKPLAQRKNLQFESESDIPANRYFEGDPTRIRQILTNLLINAVKFTQNGGITLRARIVETSLDCATIRFEVTDTGIGIAPEFQNRMFENFSQADVSMSRRFGGTGLGLAICKRLTVLMGGTISVDSRPGNGSTFQLLLPLRKSERPLNPMPLRKSRFVLPREERQNKRVLVADDNAINIEITARIVRQAGYLADCAYDGAEMLGAVKKTFYDLILMDCEMPELDGYEATKRLRAEGFDRPIVALSAHAFSRYRQQALAAGMSDFIAKPVVGRDLISAIDKWLGGRVETFTPPPPDPSSVASPFEGEIDHRIIDRLKELEQDGNDGLLCKLFDHFREVADETIGELRKAETAADADEIRKLAHSMKSVGSNLGATQVVLLCDQLESGDLAPNAIRPLIDALAAAVEAVQIKLQGKSPDVRHFELDNR